MTRYGITTPEDPNTVRIVNTPLDLATFQKLVGGYIEHVTILRDPDNPDHQIGLYINEEGRLNGLPENRIATALYRASISARTGAVVTDPFANILGPAVIVGGPDEEGEDTDLSEIVIRMIGEGRGVTVVREDL